MSYILRPQRWRTQPRVAVEIDWNNGLTNGLVFAVIPGMPGHYATYPRGLAPTVSTERDPAYGAPGVALGQDSTVLGEYAAWLKQVIPDGATQYTFLAVARHTSANVQRTWALGFGNEGSAGNAQLGLMLNSDGNGGGNADGFAFWEYNSGFNFGCASAGGIYLNGDPHTYLGLRDGTSCEVYWDGRLVTSTRPNFTLNGVNWSGISSVGVSIGSQLGSVKRACDSQWLGVIWTRTLSHAEACEVTENPWQVFRPQMRRVYVGVVVDIPQSAVIGPVLVASRNAGPTVLRFRFRPPMQVLSGVVVAGTPQILVPASDIAAGAWLPSVAAQPLYSMLDETPSDDADYDYTVSASTMEVKFTSGVDPQVSTGHVVRYRLKGNGSNSAVVTLKQGATTIAQWTETNVPSTVTLYAHTLSAGEADAITDYSDLRLNVQAV